MKHALRFLKTAGIYIATIFIHSADFAQTPLPLPCNFTVNGSAIDNGNNCFVLTTTDSNLRGSIFSDTIISLKKSFKLKAKLYFGRNDEGGDGIAFVLQNEGSGYLGNNGAGLGYHRFNDTTGCFAPDNPGPVPSFIVEFDTYQNAFIGCTNIGDPAGDHIGFMSNSDAYHTTADALSVPVEFPVNIEDGKYHPVTFSWSAAAKKMTVSFLSQTYTYTGDIVANIFQGNANVYFGFTASNGSFSPNEQKVCITSACTPQAAQEPGDDMQENILKTAVSDIKITPNPSTGLFKINFNSEFSGSAKLILTNSAGLIIETRSVQLLKNDVLNFDLVRCGKGLYFLRIISANGEQVKKILIE